MKFLIVLIVKMFLFQMCFGQTWQDTLLRIDHAFAPYLPKQPGCQFSISRNGKVIFSKAWGMADLERNVPLTTNSVLEVGSISKQFTAAAILLLEQQGKLSLNDNVRKYIPELPDYGTIITLSQMMHHTSGLRDWSAIAQLTGWPRGTKFYTNEDALDIIARQKHLNNKPGTEYLYSNSNYNLFAIIVARVSGLTLAAYTRKYIFEPAGMTHTQWRDDPNRIVPNRAIAYITSDSFRSDSTYKIDMPNEYACGNGGLLTTSEDLLKWNNFYTQGRLGTSSLLAKQLQTEPLKNGVQNDYAAGLILGNVLGWKNISHSGTTASYCAYSETFPELKLSFALLSNSSEFSVIDPIIKVRQVFVQDHTKQHAIVNSSIRLPRETLNSLSGLYVNERDNSTFELSVSKDHLEVDKSLALETVSSTSFKSDNFRIEISKGKGTLINASPTDTMHMRKVVPTQPTKEALKIYEGNYYSSETNSVIAFRLQDTKLILQLNSDKAFELTPTYKDAFKICKIGGSLNFTKEPNGTIGFVRADVDRARGLIFQKSKLKSGLSR